MPLPRPPVRRSLLAAAAVAVVVAASALTAPGQFRIRRLPVGADPLAGLQPNEDADAPVGVTVPDSPGAVERLARAAEKVQQKQWKTAADFYREAVAQFPGRVVADGPADPATGTFRYVGVGAAVQARLAKWPPEGLAVYRNLYGPAAADRLAAAGRGDTAALTAIFEDDFVTDAGRAAGVRLLDAYAEAGNFAAAAAVGNRLLDLHPMLGADRPAILFRTALADHDAGDDAAAAARSADLRQSDPRAVGTVAGRDVVLADVLPPLLATPAVEPAVDPVGADTYPSFGGPGGRGDVSPSTAKPGASLNTIALTPPDFSTAVGPQRAQWLQQDQASVRNGGARGIMPVVDAGTLFFQDGRTLYAVDADSGMPAAAWLATYPGQAGGRFHLPGPGRARGEQLTVTVTPTDVLAVMGQRDRALSGGNMFNGVGLMIGQGDAGGGPSPVRLVCLDRGTGRERWRASPADLPEAAAAARTAEYGGTPLSVPAAVAGTPDGALAGDDGGDAVLVAARGGRDGQFDNCYVVCLSARTGRYRWSTYVGSGSRTLDGDTFFGQDPSQLALADGRVLAMTNLGTVAALDPADGRVLWLDAYKRDTADTLQELQQQQMGQMPVGNTHPWTPNPVVCQGGHVFALPTDSKQLMVLDAATGRVLNRIDTMLPTTAGQRERADVLLGVYDDRAVLSGKLCLFGVDWQRYTPRTAESTRWKEQPWSEDAPETVIAARGFLTANGIYVANHQNLSEIDWQHHRIASVYPANGTFSAGQGPGNILVTSQNVVVAGTDRVDVYTDLALVTARYEAQIRAAPADPEPRVRFAAALFAGGQSDDALARMDQAIDLIGGRPAMRPGPGRTMVFDALLDFGRRLSERVPATPSPDPAVVRLAGDVFDRAADAADGPDQRVAYLLARGRFAHEVTHDYAAEVELAQRVLSDPTLRRVAVTDDQTAAAVAAAAIAADVALDRSAYAAVEARAAAALADARGRGDPDALLSVADVYPNSRAATTARQAAVDQFQAGGRPAQAIAILRQMYAAVGDPVVKAAVLQQIAADFLATGPAGVGPAADRLARAGQLTPFNPVLAADLRLPDGSVLARGRGTYGDAVTALRGTLAAADAARLPDFHLPTYEQAGAAFAAAHNGTRPTARQVTPFRPGPGVIADVTALVHPAREFNRNDRVLTWSPAGLAAYDVGQTTPRFRAAMADAPIGAAWVDAPATSSPTTRPASPGRWLVWTPTGVTALSDDGRDLWPAAVAMAGLSSPPAVATAGGGAVVDDTPPNPADPDGLNQQQVVINGQVVNVRVRGGNRAFVIRNNRLVPAPVLPVPGPPPVVPGGGEQIATAQPAGPAGDALLVATTTGRLLAVDGNTGRTLWQTRPADHPVDAVLANAHFTVARINDPAGATVIVYDTPTGQVLGRRKFTPDNTAGQLVNLALGEEGTLAVTRTSGIEVIDLYDPWRDPATPLAARGNPDNALWTGMGQPNQLLVQAGRVVSLYDAGRYAVAYDLCRSKSDPTNPLPTGGGDLNAWATLVGPDLFVVQPNNVKRFNLADPEDVSRAMLSSYDYHVRGLLLGSDAALIVDDPTDRGPAGSPNISLLAVSRAPIPGRRSEQDLLQFVWARNDPSGLTDWIGVDGGLYLLTGDHRLHAFAGARPPP